MAASFSGDGSALTGVVVGTAQVTGLGTFVTNLAQQTDKQRTTAASATATLALGANDAEIILIDSTAAPVTVTLPASPSAGRLFTIKDAAGSAAGNHITVSAGSSNIDGSATRTIAVANGFVTVVYSGARWAVTAEASPPAPTRLGPVVSAYSAANQTSGQLVVTKINFDTTEFDTDGSFDTTNHRFKPNKAGYYRVAMQLNMTETASGGFTLYLFLSKNGSIIKQSIQLINFTAGFNQSMNLDTIVYLNGSTDSLDGSFETNSGTATILGGASTTFFSANYVHD